MNCRLGDLALVIAPSDASFVGLMVRCEKFVPYGTEVWGFGYPRKTIADAWVVDRVLVPSQSAFGSPFGPLDRVIADKFLLPLRPPEEPAEFSSARAPGSTRPTLLPAFRGVLDRLWSDPDFPEPFY